MLPGIRCLPTPGHVPFHQSVLIESGGERACFLADLVPTSAHLPLPWIMGYDLEPLVTLETRRRLYGRAEAEAGGSASSTTRRSRRGGWCATGRGSALWTPWPRHSLVAL